MNKYKAIEKILGSKFCPDCGKALNLEDNEIFCLCGFTASTELKDKTRNKNKITKGDYRKSSTKEKFL